MQATLPCTIQLLCDASYTCVMLCFRKQDAEHLLILLNALELRRIGQIECRSPSASVAFSLDSAHAIRFGVPGTAIQSILSGPQLEVLKCCCIDSALGSYPEPHVDYELDARDLTVSFEGGDMP